MAAALAQFLGEAPSAAALQRPSSVRSGLAQRPSRRRRSSEDSSDGDDAAGDEVPRYDGGFDDTRDYDAAAPFSAPQPRRMPYINYDI